MRMILGIDASRANHEHKSGVEWYAFFVIEELKKIIPPDVQIILYANKPLTGSLSILPNHWTPKVLKWPPQKLWTQCRLSFEMFIHKPDVLFIPAHVPPAVHPRKTVMTVHDVAAVRFPETYNRFERWYTIASARYAVRNLPAIIVPSQSVKNDLMRLAPKTDAKKIHAIFLGVNTFFCKDIPTSSPVPCKPYILSVGRLEEKKNTARIITAFEKATDRGMDADLVLVGTPGHGYEKVVSALKNCLYKNKIKIIPRMEEGDLVQLMQNARMFVFPSLYEGFGLPVLEAFATGVPVIASSVGSLPEVAGDAAVFVDPFNVDELAVAMVELNCNESMRTEFVKRGLKRVQEFSWEKTASATWDVLRLLCP